MPDVLYAKIDKRFGAIIRDTVTARRKCLTQSWKASTLACSMSNVEQVFDKPAALNPKGVIASIIAAAAS